MRIVAADGVADDDGAVVEGRHLLPDRRTPGRVARVVLVGHSRVADLVPVPELPPQAVDQLVVPLVVRAGAAALDEQDLTDFGHQSQRAAAGARGRCRRPRPG